MRDQRPDTVGQGADNTSEILETLDKRHGKATCYRPEVFGASRTTFKDILSSYKVDVKWTSISIALFQSTYRSKRCKTLVIFPHR